MRALSIDTRLDAIAGKPAGMVVGAGSVSVDAVATGAFSLYVVWDRVAPSTNASNIGGIYSSDSTYTTIRARADGAIEVGWKLAGSTTRRISAAEGVGLNVAVIVAPAGRVTFDAVTLFDKQTITPVPGGGAFSNPVLRVDPAVATQTPLLAAAYPAVHTEYQRTAIMRKLLQMSGV